MRVSIIGPVTPFRSGIARHTTALARALADRPEVEVLIYSFARQYPPSMYPGESDRDLHGTPPDHLEAHFSIDSLNPMSWRETAKQVLQAQPDLAVMPAWTFFVAPCLGYIASALRRQGIPVIIVVHNAEDHEAARWKRTLSRFQLRKAKLFVTHNEAIAADLERLAPHIPVRIRPHPIYDDYPDPRGSLVRRAELELLFFGLIRPYKGLDVALRALALSKLGKVRFTIVGEFWQDRAETEALIRQLRLDDRVDIVPSYVSDQEAAEYFARCDAVVAPYRSATGSGVVALAQWYERPVIGSDVPGLAQSISDGVTGWLFPAEDVEGLAELLRSKVTRDSARAMRPAIKASLAELSWSRFAEMIVDLADH